MPFPILWPIGVALGLAFLSDLASPATRQVHRKSIEVCTAMCQMHWLKEDGVVRVYSEVTHLNCSRIVVEIAPGAVAPYVPGDVEGHPVVVRMGDAYGGLADILRHMTPSEAAANQALKQLKRWGRPLAIRPTGGPIVFTPASGEYNIAVLHSPQSVVHPSGKTTTVSGPLTDAEKRHLTWYAERNGALGSILDFGDRTVVSYFPTRHAH